MEKQKTNIIKYRKIIILLLFFIVLPLITLGIVAITYRVESSRIVAAFENENKVTLYKSSFEEFDQGTSGSYDFDLLEIKPTIRYTYYDTTQDAKEKVFPIGYGVKLEVKADVKENADSLLDGQKYETLVYCGIPVHFDKNYKDNLKDDKNKNVNVKFEKKTFTKDSTSSQNFYLKIKGQLPYSIPFVGQIKDPIVYIIVRVPYKNQPGVDKLIKDSMESGKGDPSEVDKRKALIYQDFRFKITVNSKYIADKEIKHERY